jgi:pilus assembly protein Flp/PilA
MFAFAPQFLFSLLLRVTAPRLAASRNEHGASAVEYGLMVAGIAAVIVGVVFIFGQGIFVNLFTGTCNSIAVNSGGSC